jgi:two-component system sensor histidine kinase MtrB
LDTDSKMDDKSPRSPRRFRRRLTAAFVLVAAVSAGVVATVTFLLAREYRWRNLRSTSLEETRFALAVAPIDLDDDSFERFRNIYEQRIDADILIVQDSEEFTSSANLSTADIPDELQQLTAEPSLVTADHDGRRTLVAGAIGRDDGSYYLFFSLAQFDESVNELARVAAIAWILTLIAGAGIGSLVARRTLRPVARTAQAAHEIAAGNLGARLPVGGTDEFGTLAASFNDMADKVQSVIDRLADAAERERRFTADVAHELRTPLTGLAASAALLGDRLDALPPGVRRPAAILVADVARLRNLVVELLELAQIDAGNDLFEPVPLNVRSVVEAVIESAESRRSAPLLITIDSDLYVAADAARLRRILGNLIDNAVVHGGGTAHVDARAECDDIVIEVVDEGPGIAPDELEKIFDRFHKSDQSRATGGTGLGLAIARHYAAGEGGSLSAHNESAHGARFTLRLPAAHVEPPDVCVEQLDRMPSDT